MSTIVRAGVVLVPVLLAVLWSPLPQQLGLYEYLLSQDPVTVGSLPASFASEADWGFTFDDLYKDGKRLEGESAIVTGANSGTGYAISLALAKLGADVTMACRNPSKCEKAATAIREDPAAKGKVNTLTVDLSSLASVKKFCQDYLATHTNDQGKLRSLDMLFLNAGILEQAPKDDGSPALSIDGIETVFATNVVGHHLMFKLLRPAIFRFRRSTPARIVQTSSSESMNTIFPYKVATDRKTLNTAKYTGMGAYAQSKLAQVLWVRELTARLDAENTLDNPNPNGILYANAANPGAVASNMKPHGPPSWFTLAGLVPWTPEEGALTPLYLGTALKDLQAKKVRGQYFHPQSQRMDHKDARDGDPDTKALQERLWKFLDDLVKDVMCEVDIAGTDAINQHNRKYHKTECPQEVGH